MLSGGGGSVTLEEELTDSWKSCVLTLCFHTRVRPQVNQQHALLRLVLCCSDDPRLFVNTGSQSDTAVDPRAGHWEPEGRWGATHPSHIEPSIFLVTSRTQVWKSPGVKLCFISHKNELKMLSCESL